MNEERLTIGEMARLNNISVQTLRLYSNLGLIEPAHVDPFTRYRYYDVKQSYVLDIIGYLKNLGMQLSDIRAAFREPNLDTISAAMEGREEAFEAEIRRLQAAQASVARFQERIAFLRLRPELRIPVMETKPERRLHHFPANSNFHTDGPGYFEHVMRDMRTWLLASGLPLAYFSNVSARIRATDFLAGDLHTYSLFIWSDDYSEQFLPIETLPAADYLCIYFDGFTQEPELADRLRHELSERQLQVVGDYVVETVFDFPLSSLDIRRTQLCIQVPVIAN